MVKKKSDKGILAAVSKVDSPTYDSRLTLSQLRITPSTFASDDFRRTCRSKLLGCLADLTSQPTTAQNGERVTVS